jgi:hypothetical protein
MTLSIIYGKIPHMDITRDNLLGLIRTGLKNKATGISALEKESGVPKDTIRDFLRGKTQILRADKLQKILRVLEPTDKVFVTGTINEGGEISFMPLSEHIEVNCPPGFDPADIVAVRVKGDAMLPLFYDGWVVYYTARHDKSVPAIKGGMQVPYNTSAKDPLAELLNKPCVSKLKDGRIFLRTLKAGTNSKRYNLVSYNSPDINDTEIEWLAKIVFIKTN